MKKTLIPFVLCCMLAVSMIRAQNAPVTTAGSSVFSEPATTIAITATGFTDIGSCNLLLVYDPSIVLATSVTAGSQLGGYLNFNVSDPGFISLGWYTYPGCTVPDNTLLFTLSFLRVSPGTTAISFSDNGYSCIYYSGSWAPLNDSPASSFYIPGSLTVLSTDAPLTAAPNLAACPGSDVSVPVTVSNFSHIGSVTLQLQYDPSVLVFQTATGNALFPGLSVDGSVAGVISVTGTAPATGSGVTLPSDAELVTVHFTYLGGSTSLSWIDNGPSCSYTGPPPGLTILNDTPQDLYYLNGSVVPEAAGVCDKQVHIRLYVQGLYQSGGHMSQAFNESGPNFGSGIADQVTVELHDAADYNATVLTLQNLALGTDGIVNFSIPAVYNGFYYLTIRHRNSIPVVSATAISFSGSTIIYEFASSALQTYGDNMIQMADGIWALYTGDVNQDGLIDSSDLIMVDNDVSVFATGYLPGDCNGDGLIDSSDMMVVDNNSNAFIGAVYP